MSTTRETTGVPPALEDTGVWPELELDVTVVVPVTSAAAEVR